MRGVFLVIIVILIVFLYVQYYTKYKQEYQILQVYLNKFKLDTLYERYPIVIYDQVVDPNEVLKTALAYSFVFKTDMTVEQEQVNRVSHKYLMLYSEDDDVAIKIINPKYKKEMKTVFSESNVQYVTVKLKAKQILILPALWYFYTDNMGVTGIGLDDLVSKWFYALY